MDNTPKNRVPIPDDEWSKVYDWVRETAHELAPKLEAAYRALGFQPGGEYPTASEIEEWIYDLVQGLPPEGGIGEVANIRVEVHKDRVALGAVITFTHKAFGLLMDGEMKSMNRENAEQIQAKLMERLRLKRQHPEDRE